jgi:hypothetical protein
VTRDQELPDGLLSLVRAVAIPVLQGLLARFPEASQPSTKRKRAFLIERGRGAGRIDRALRMHARCLVAGSRDVFDVRSGMRVRRIHLSFPITGAQKLRSADLGQPARVAAWNALTWVEAVAEPAVGRQN